MAVATAAALLGGCIVTSVCPFYTKGDLVAEPGLTGDWLRDLKDRPAEVWKFEPRGGGKYRITLIEERSATVLDAHLFKLHDQLFLELASMDEDYHVIPPHFLLKVSQFNPELRMAQLNHEWLKELVTQEPDAIRHHFVEGNSQDEKRLVLTAGTAELQKFIIKYLENENAWKTGFDLRKQ